MPTMMFRFPPVILLFVALMLSSCDYSIVEQVSSPGSRSNVGIIVVPQIANVAPSDRLQLRAIVTGTTNTEVAWSIDSGPGEVYQDGMFFAPADSTLATTIVRARSKADTSRSATATLTITGEPIDASVKITIAPLTASVVTGSTRQFTASVTGTTNTSVVWSVVGLGEVSATGLYTAPPSVYESPTDVAVQVTSIADPRAVARATVTLTGAVYDSNAICFEREIMPIFSSNCSMSECHGAIKKEEGFDFRTASGVLRGVRVGQPDESKVYRVITGRGDDMPPPPRAALTPDQIAKIRTWIQKGAGTGACVPPPTNGCDTANVTYSRTIRDVLSLNCLGCHSGASAEKGIDLSQYAGVKTHATSGKLIGSIDHASGVVQMPQGLPKLDDCTIRKFKVWVAAGAPNN